MGVVERKKFNNLGQFKGYCPWEDGISRSPYFILEIKFPVTGVRKQVSGCRMLTAES